MGKDCEVGAGRRLSLVKCGVDSLALSLRHTVPVQSGISIMEQPGFSVDSWLYSRVFFSLPEPTLLVEVVTGCVVDANDAALKNLAIRCSEVIGKNLKEVLSYLRCEERRGDPLGSLEEIDFLFDYSALCIDSDAAQSASSGFSYVKIKGRAGDYALVRIFPQSNNVERDQQLTPVEPENLIKNGIGAQKKYGLALLDSLCARSILDTKYFVVFSVGLDSFSEYERNFGSVFSQRLVKCVEELLSEITPVGSGVFQLDESSIAVVVPAPTKVESFGDHVRYCLSKPLVIDDFKFKVSVSVGCYFSSFGDDLNSDTCIERVTSAKNRAVLEGGDKVVFYDCNDYTTPAELLSSTYSVREFLSREDVVCSFIPYVSQSTSRRTLRMSFGIGSWLQSPNQVQSDFNKLILMSSNKELSEWKVSKALSILSDWVSSENDLVLAVVLDSDVFSAPDFVNRLEIILGRFEYNVRSRLLIELSCNGPDSAQYNHIFGILSGYGVGCSLRLSRIESVFAGGFDGSIVNCVVVPGLNLGVDVNYLGALYIIQALSALSCRDSIEIFVEQACSLPEVEIYRMFGIGVIVDSSSNLSLSEVTEWYEKLRPIECDGYFGCRCLNCFKFKIKRMQSDKLVALRESSDNTDMLLDMLRIGLASVFRQLSSDVARSPRLESLMCRVVMRVRSISRAYFGLRGQRDVFLKVAKDSLELFDEIERFLLTGK